MKPILFLNIDGVLNSMEWLKRRPEVTGGRGYSPLTDENIEAERALDPDAIRRLNVVVERTGCLVVLSSSWRKLYPLTVVDRMLHYRGFEGQLFAATPHHRGWGKPVRGTEIAWWLTQLGHPDERPPFAIVDDDSDMEPYMDRLVQTDNKTGLLDEHVERLVEMLRGKR